MNAATHNVYAIILAAGASSRLGQPKQLLNWRKQPLLAHTIQSARTILEDRVLVVLGCNIESILSSVNLEGVSTITNPNWQEGIASSIRAGIEGLPDTAAAVLILLCDQPLVNAIHLQNLLNGWRYAPEYMIASQYRQSVGVPALFPASYFPELMQLKGDQGAKPLLKKFQSQVLTVPLLQAELDIDCAEDFERLTRDYPAEVEA